MTSCSCTICSCHTITKAEILMCWLITVGRRGALINSDASVNRWVSQHVIFFMTIALKIKIAAELLVCSFPACLKCSPMNRCAFSFSSSLINHPGIVSSTLVSSLTLSITLTGLLSHEGGSNVTPVETCTLNPIYRLSCQNRIPMLWFSR